MDETDIDRAAYLEYGIAEALAMLTESQCCGFFACPGPQHPLVGMASCAQSFVADELRMILTGARAVCTENPCLACGREIRCGKPVLWDGSTVEPCYLWAGHSGECDA